jgi:hypothetical protein
VRVLVACEYSGVVRDAFLGRGHHAMSCDLLPSETPGPHYTGSVLDDIEDGWDLMIAHPPCTYLTNAGVRHLHSTPSINGVLPEVHGEARWRAMDEAAALFRALLDAPIAIRAIENPTPHRYAVERIGRTYDQAIQPWMFGHGETKRTCLWLKGVPPLIATLVATGRAHRIHAMSPGPDRAKRRSRTYDGIAEAMATQWSGLEAVDAG